MLGRWMGDIYGSENHDVHRMILWRHRIHPWRKKPLHPTVKNKRFYTSIPILKGFEMRQQAAHFCHRGQPVNKQNTTSTKLAGGGKV